MRTKKLEMVTEREFAKTRIAIFVTAICSNEILRNFIESALNHTSVPSIRAQMRTHVKFFFCFFAITFISRQ